MDGHLGQHLAVNLDIGVVDSVHEPAIRDAIHARCCVDARDPETTHIALAIAAVTVHIRQRTHDGLVRGAEEPPACATMAFGQLQDLLMLFVCGYAAFDSWHSSWLSSHFTCA